MKWLAASLATLSLVVLATLASPQADGITLSGLFSDDNGHLFEADIDAIAAEGITKGCNPPTNSSYCPDDDVDRGQMAAFLRRALDIPSSDTDFFVDDNTSTFEGDINAIATRGITRGCNPPTNSNYCPTSEVSRGEMAAFLKRGLELPAFVQRIPLGRHDAMDCSKDGERCTLNVDLSAGRRYRVQEGVFRVNNATQTEQDQFDSPNTGFTLTLDGSTVSTAQIPLQSGSGVTNRLWRADVVFSPGTHTLMGRWRWAGKVIQRTTITVTADG